MAHQSASAMLDRLVELLSERLPGLIAVYRFGSFGTAVQRADSDIDLTMHLVRIRGLGLPQKAADAFTMLETAGVIPADITRQMHAMVGFRTISIHQYRELNIAILRSVLDKHLDDFTAFTKAVIQSCRPR